MCDIKYKKEKCSQAMDHFKFVRRPKRLTEFKFKKVKKNGIQNKISYFADIYCDWSAIVANASITKRSSDNYSI